MHLLLIERNLSIFQFSNHSKIVPPSQSIFLSVENQLKGSSFPDLRPDLDVALVSAHDLLGNAQADARPFLFGGKERDENLAKRFLFDSFAGIGHFEDDFPCFIDVGTERYGFLIRIFQGLNGILQEVDQHLLDLILIPKEDQFAWIENFSKANALGFELMLKQDFELVEKSRNPDAAKLGCWNMGQTAEF